MDAPLYAGLKRL